MLNIFLCIYLIIVLNVIIHEFCHIIAAKILKIKLYGIYFGNKMYVIKYKKINISPIILQGHIEIDVKEIKDISKVKLSIFFFSGVLGNIILTILLGVYINNIILNVGIIIIGSNIVVRNTIPWIYEENDINLLIDCFREN
ncbi:MAG: site-2 protease family protein [Eubacteriales bacterium]